MPLKSKAAGTMIKAIKKCCTRGCKNNATSPRAKFCAECFKKNARSSSCKRTVFGGNANGSPGNAGNSQGSPGNAGNSQGSPGNAGNVKKGKRKKMAGGRSGVRRSAKRALVVKKQWLDLILTGRKTWEIRGSSTTKRGWIHFAESQAGGKLMGRARLVSCHPVPRKSFDQQFDHHCVPCLDMVPYHPPYAWVLKDAEKFENPFEYKHKKGAVIWVDV